MDFSTFRKTTRNHKLIIHKDDGVFRHITLKNSESYNRHYHLTTWPGYLAVSGDMGEWVFTRLQDMFDFFRAGPYEQMGKISFRYWAEKCRAADKNTLIWAYDEDLYVQAIRSDMASYLSGFSLSEAKTIVSEAIYDDLFVPPETQDGALEKAMYWDCPVNGGFPFQDFWDHRLQSLTPGFKWICYAIQWGIRQYDLEKSGNTQSHHDKRILKGEN